MYRLTLLWLALCAASFAVGYWRGRLVRGAKP